MATIRPLQPDDLGGVEALLGAHLEGWEDDRTSLAALTFEHPWADPELRSLVAADERGAIVGFIAAQPRRLRFEQGELRGICCSHLVVDPGARGGAVGALLLGELMRGPQDLTFSDTATEEVARIWALHGGRVDATRAHDWMLVLRAWRWGERALLRAARERGVDRRAVPVAALPLQSLGRRVLSRAHPPPDPSVGGADAGAGEIAAAIPEASRRIRLRLDWDEAALAHTLRQLAAAGARTVTRIVSRRGRPIGWYAYEAGPVARVLHLGAPPRQADAVLGELLAHAREHGSTAVAGRSEPHLEPALRHRFAVFGYARKLVVHARDAEVDRALARDDSLLSRLDGEWYFP